MAVTYLAVVEHGTNRSPEDWEREYRFFTCRRPATEDSPKTLAEAEEWVSSVLRERGTSNCRATLARVLWSIAG